MTRRRRRKGDILIDLTSLLDVIFIVLLVVICYASVLNNNATETETAKTEAIQNANNSQQAYDTMLDELEEGSLANYIGYIVVRIPPNEDNYRNRQLLLLEKGERELSVSSLEGNNTEVSYNSLRDSIEEYVKNHNDVPVVVSVNDNDEDILYRDEVAVQGILEELSEKYDNLYRK